MPQRNIVVANGEIYHVLNRGVGSQEIFRNPTDYIRFTSLLDYYQLENPSLSYSQYLELSSDSKLAYMETYSTNRKIIEVYAYCLMNNHFHLLLRQVNNNGIYDYFRKVQNAYVKYFNLKYNRNGTLFQSRFQAKWIESEEIFLHVSRYIHLNPCTAYIVRINNLVNYRWSSYSKYAVSKDTSFVNTKKLTGILGGKLQYQEFVQNQSDYQRKLAKIKHLVLE